MSNFSVLSQHDEQLFRLGILAEKYFADDPNTCLLKLRQLAESLTQMLLARIATIPLGETKNKSAIKRHR